ncbi:MAG: amidohydrolase [Firmicutes bacterium]|nr:amidohydrolase [Bacillota bacterium]
MNTIVYKNAKIYTLDAQNSTAEAMVCRDGRILAIGSEETVTAAAGADPEVIDLGGKTVIPGIIDSHTHYHWTAKAEKDLALLGKTLPEIKEIVARRAAELPEGTWIVGSGWLNALFPGGAWPDRKDLDEAAPNHPVFLIRACGNSYWANSKAFEMAGIDGNTPDPNGEILRRADGSPSGVLMGWFAQNIAKLIPLYRGEEYKDMLRRTQQAYLKYGITSISDEGAGAFTAFGTGNGKLTVETLKELYEEDSLQLRIYMNVAEIQHEYYREVLADGPRSGLYGGRFDFRGVKIWADGSQGTRTAYVLNGYKDDPSNHGKRYYDDAELVRLFREIDAAGFQTTVHAIGDAACRQIIDCYEEAFGADDTEDRRFKIVHFQLATPEDIKRFVKHHMICNTQFGQYGEDLDFADIAIGREKFLQSYDWRSILDLGGRVIGSSDSPLDSADPFEGLYVGVTRRNLAGENPLDDHPDRGALTREEALRSYTTEAAYAMFEEDVKGSLEPGKYADFAVISDDYFECPADAIKEIRVLRTVIGGKTVFEG